MLRMKTWRLSRLKRSGTYQIENLCGLLKALAILKNQLLKWVIKLRLETHIDGPSSDHVS